MNVSIPHMRKSASWMSIWDDRILEYIDENEGGSVGEIGSHELFRVSNPHVSRRCKVLAAYGLLRPLGNGVYVITSEGQQYLAGELDAGDLTEEEEGNEEAAA